MSNAKDWLASKWKNSSSDAKKSTKKSPQTGNIFDSKTIIVAVSASYFYNNLFFNYIKVLSFSIQVVEGKTYYRNGYDS